MSFPGKEKLSQEGGNGGGWVKLVKGVPQKLTILGYVGTVESKKYPGKHQYRYQVAQDGVMKKFDANWRLNKALTEMVEQLDSAFEVTITMNKVIADVNGQDRLVNDYVLKDVTPVALNDVAF